jgi:hypothetical protein
VRQRVSPPGITHGLRACGIGTAYLLASFTWAFVGTTVVTIVEHLHGMTALLHHVPCTRIWYLGVYRNDGLSGSWLLLGDEDPKGVEDSSPFRGGRVTFVEPTSALSDRAVPT